MSGNGNLPPGVTDAMIERAYGSCVCDEGECVVCQETLTVDDCGEDFYGNPCAMYFATDGQGEDHPACRNHEDYRQAWREPTEDADGEWEWQEPEKAPRPIHTKDEDCFVGDDGCCVLCGVSHACPCEICDGKGFHKDGCPVACYDDPAYVAHNIESQKDEQAERGSR